MRRSRFDGRWWFFCDWPLTCCVWAVAAAVSALILAAI